MTQTPRALPLLLAGCLAVFGAPGLPPSFAGKRVTVSQDGVRHYEWSSLLSGLEVELEGDVEFTDDDRDVARLSPGGHLTIEKRDGFHRRSVRFETDEDGVLRHEYRAGGKRRELDQEARTWIAETLPQVIRETGIGAEGRVARILQEQGVSGVFDEIERIEASRATSIYCVELLEQGDLDSAELDRLAALARRGIASSGEQARFLIRASDAYIDSGACASYFEVTRSIPSSGDHARVLIHVLEHHTLEDPDALRLLLRSARGIASSGDKARVLIRATAYYRDDAEIREAFFDTTGSVASSGDRTRVLIALIDAIALDAPSMARLCDTARRVPSSGDRTRVLIALAPSYDNHETVRQACFDAATSIPSSGDHARALTAFLERGDLDHESLLALLDSTRSIASSGDKTRVLVRAAEVVSGDDDLVAAYLETADTIPSSGDQRRARSALVR